MMRRAVLLPQVDTVLSKEEQKEIITSLQPDEADDLVELHAVHMRFFRRLQLGLE